MAPRGARFPRSTAMPASSCRGCSRGGDDVGVPDWVPIDSFDEGAAGHGDRSRADALVARVNGRGRERVLRTDLGPSDRRGSSAITLRPRRVRAKVQHMEDGYTQLGTVLTDQRPEDSEGDGVIVVGRFKGDPYDGVQLSYEAGRRNLYLTPEGALRLAFLLAAAVERDVDIR
jgi:hypothetical protein